MPIGIEMMALAGIHAEQANLHHMPVDSEPIARELSRIGRPTLTRHWLSMAHGDGSGAVTWAPRCLSSRHN
jgi:hypothetical protein